MANYFLPAFSPMKMQFGKQEQERERYYKPEQEKIISYSTKPIECEECLWSPPSPSSSPSPSALSFPSASSYKPFVMNFSVWDKKILCSDCFESVTDAHFEDFIKNDILTIDQELAKEANKSRFKLRISTSTRKGLYQIGWTPEMVCRLLEACNRDCIASYECNLTRIRILAKPQLKNPPNGLVRDIEGCDCTQCAIAVSDGADSFLPNKWGRKAYTPRLFMEHSLKWSAGEIKAFLLISRHSSSHCVLKSGKSGQSGQRGDEGE